MCAILGRFVGMNEFLPTNTKFCDLDLDFALQWTRTHIDFSSSISYTNSEHFQLQCHIHIFSFSLFSIWLTLSNPIIPPLAVSCYHINFVNLMFCLLDDETLRAHHLTPGCSCCEGLYQKLLTLYLTLHNTNSQDCHPIHIISAPERQYLFYKILITCTCIWFMWLYVYECMQSLLYDR